MVVPSWGILLLFVMTDQIYYFKGHLLVVPLAMNLLISYGLHIQSSLRVVFAYFLNSFTWG